MTTTEATALPMAQALELHARGWHPIPVAVHAKVPACKGVTGHSGSDADLDQIRGWLAGSEAGANLGLRMAVDMIGLDIDQRDGKTGHDKLDAFRLEHDLPELPPTVFVTSRVWPSGILLYRVPLGLRFNDSAIGDVDIIQRHHRFVMAPGSVHPKTGQTYTATDLASGEVLEVLPYADEVADLPIEWVDALRKHDRRAEGRPAIEWDNPHRDTEPWSTSVQAAYRKHWAEVKHDGRHPALVAVLTALFRLDSRRFAGTGLAIDAVRRDFIDLVTEDGTRTEAEAIAEFDDAVRSQRETVATTKSTAGQAEDREVGAPEPSDFFDRNSGLLAVDLGRWVLGQGPIRPGLDGRLWAWTDGYWQPTGKEEARRRVRTGLGNRFRPAHFNTLEAWLRAEETLDPNRPDFSTINCSSGLLDWRTGDLRPHSPSHPSTTRLPVRWNPDATCPAIEEFLGQVLADDAHEFFYEVLGYLCAAGNPLHKAVLFLGAGRNGKGTTLRLIEQLLGPNNCANVTPHQLADNRFAAAGLYGKLANIAGDLEARLIERTDLFKMATGGDAISAEHKYGDAFTFRCWATFAFSANEAPAVRDHSEGYYSRWLVVPFHQTIGTEERLPEHVLDARLHAPSELEGLFARGVEGLRRLMDRGRFELPASVHDATEQFRADTDPVAQFLAEETHLDPEGWVLRSSLYGNEHDGYRRWCTDNGRGPVAASKFYARVKGLPGVAEGKREGKRGFRGLSLGGADGADAPSLSRAHGGKGREPAPSAPSGQWVDF